MSSSSTSEAAKPAVRSSSILDKERHRSSTVNATYRRAILQAIESLHDFQSRSNIDLVRRHTQAILTDNDTNNKDNNHNNTTTTTTEWNDKIFLKTLKSVVSNGDVDLLFGSYAELSTDYKRKRADSLLMRMQAEIEQNNGNSTGDVLLPPLTVAAAPKPEHPVKVPPKRPSEHEKWKIMPKKVYDKTTIVNPMDTN